MQGWYRIQNFNFVEAHVVEEASGILVFLTPKVSLLGRCSCQKCGSGFIFDSILGGTAYHTPLWWELQHVRSFRALKSPAEMKVLLFNS